MLTYCDFTFLVFFRHLKESPIAERHSSAVGVGGHRLCTNRPGGGGRSERERWEMFSKKGCEKFAPAVWAIEGVLDITAAVRVPSGTASDLVP